MSSAVVSTSAAHGRPFLFDADPKPKVGSHVTHVGTAAIGCPVERSSTELRDDVLESTIKNQPSKILPSSVVPASRLEIRPAPEMASSGIPAIDALTGGLPRGGLTEICGSASSGRTTVVLSALAAATRRGEFCALIDASDALDPQSLDAASVDLDRLLWVRCSDAKQTRTSEHRLEQVLRATDLLLESGGFGLLILDLADVPAQSARRIPLTTWFRFRRAVEHKPTILLAIEQQPIAGSCSSLLLQLASQKFEQKSSARQIPLQSNSSREAASCESPARQCWIASERRGESRRDGTHARWYTNPAPTHAHLLSGLQITAELIRSRVDRKPSQSITFDTKTAWAG
jgi:hypothetical protein